MYGLHWKEYEKVWFVQLILIACLTCISVTADFQKIGTK